MVCSRRWQQAISNLNLSYFISSWYNIIWLLNAAQGKSNTDLNMTGDTLFLDFFLVRCINICDWVRLFCEVEILHLLQRGLWAGHNSDRVFSGSVHMKQQNTLNEWCFNWGFLKWFFLVEKLWRVCSLDEYTTLLC